MVDETKKRSYLKIVESTPKVQNASWEKITLFHNKMLAIKHMKTKEKDVLENKKKRDGKLLRNRNLNLYD